MSDASWAIGKQRQITSAESFNQIKDFAQDQLRKIQAGQGERQSEILKRMNDALSQSLDKAGALVDMIRHFRSMADLRENLNDAPVTTKLQGLVDRILHAMQYTFPLQRVTILKSIPPDLSPVPVPQEHLETILFNLIQFARQEINGNVGTVHIEGTAKKRESLNPAKCEYHDLRIKYSCPSPVQGESDDLFDPCQETTDEDQSARFGLFVAKKLVEHHGGSVKLVTTPSVNTFYLEFPAE